MVVKVNHKIKIPQEEIIVTFIMVFFSADTMVFSNSSNYASFVIKNAVLIGLLCFQLIKIIINKIKLQKELIVLALTLILFSFLTLVVNSGSIAKYGYEFTLILVAFLAVSLYSRQKLLIAFGEVIYFLSVWACLVYLLWLTFPSITKIMPSFYNGSGYTIFNGLLSILPGQGIIEKYRLFGFCREPGVFAVYVSLALGLELFTTKQFNRRRIIVLTIAGILTFSTTAYIVIVPMYLIYTFFRRERKGNQRSKPTIIVIAVVLVLFVFMNSNVNRIVFSKIITSSGSAIARFSAIPTNLHIMFGSLKNFISGAGFEGVETSYASVSALLGYYSAHNTNTIFKIAAVHGAFYVSCIVLYLYRFCRKTFYGKPVCVFMFAVICALFSAEAFDYNVLLYLFVFMGTTKQGSVEYAFNS